MFTTSATLLAEIRDPANDTSWREFYDRYAPLIHAMAQKHGLATADAEEVVQLVMLAIARGIEDYDLARGQFRRWLLGVTRNKISDVSSSRGRPVAELPEQMHGEDHFERLWERQWRECLLQRAIDIVRREGNDRAFQVFWLRVVEGWPVADVADVLNVKTERVYEYKHRVGRRIAEEYDALCSAADQD